VLCCCLRGFAEPERRPAAPPEGAKITSDDDAKTIVTKAIHAHGGADKLSRWSKGYVKYQASGGFAPPGFGEAVLEDTFDLPGHFKRVIRAKMGMEEITIITVHNDGKGWVIREGKCAVIVLQPLRLSDSAEPVESLQRTETAIPVLCDMKVLRAARAAELARWNYQCLMYAG
jgi:hypothetical protein